MHAVGTVDDVTGLFERHSGAGARQSIITPRLSLDVDATRAAFGSKIMPRLRKK